MQASGGELRGRGPAPGPRGEGPLLQARPARQHHRHTISRIGKVDMQDFNRGLAIFKWQRLSM